MGTRFLPATKASPKEMLPIVDKPLIQWAVEEAYAAGIQQMIFVTGRNKRAIEDHFDTAYELEAELEAAGKEALLSVVRTVKPDDMQCVFVRQPGAHGLGHAVLCAEGLVGDEHFAVLLADDLLVGSIPVMKQMTDVYEEYHCSVLAVQEVPLKQTQSYGVVKGTSTADKLLAVDKIVEKPRPEVAPSNLAVTGRYILSPTIFEAIKRQPRGAGREIQLTDGIASLLGNEQVLAYRYDGERYDCGSKLGFLQANVVLGEQHHDAGEDFAKWLSSYVNRKGAS